MNGVASFSGLTLSPAGSYTLSISSNGLTPASASITVSSSTPTTATVTGNVFLDLNAGGTSQTGEPGLFNHTVFLDLNNNGKLDAGEPLATTDGAGNFTLSNLTPGSYTLRLLTYPGDVVTGPSSANYSITVSAGQVLGGQNFGMQLASLLAPVTPSSGPFGSTNPTLDAALVQGVYHLILGRAADAPGLAYWTGQLETGLTVSDMASAFYHATEYDTSLVTSFYQTYFGRSPDGGGLNYWVKQLQAGLNDIDLAEGLLSSPEYSTLHPSNQDFAQSAYQNVLSRAADASGLTYWTQSLTNGTVNRATLMHDFLHYPEVYLRAIDSFYVGFFGRVSDSAGEQGWFGLIQGGSKTLFDVAASVLGSLEFAHLASLTVH